MRGFAEMPIDVSIMAEHLAVIREGIKRMTDTYLAAPFPQLIARIDEVGWKMEAGLYRRTGTDESGNAEEKFFFHHVPEVGWPEEEAGQYTEFIMACDAVNTAGKNIALALAAEIDEIHGQIYPELPSLHSALKAGTAITRALRYLFGIDAYPHLDRSAISICWWGSHPGLVIIDRSGKHHQAQDTALDRAMLLTGKKFAGLLAGDPREYPDGQYGFGTLHGVKNTRCADAARSGDRFSLVTFVHPKLTPEAAAWIQAKEHEMDAYEKKHPL